MSNLALDTNWDLLVVNNRVPMTSGRDAIAQHMRARFQTFLGEWFLDNNAGVPWYRDILVKQPIFSLVQDDLKRVILETPGVLELIEFEFDYESERTLALDFKCQSIDGIIDYTQTVGI